MMKKFYLFILFNVLIMWHLGATNVVFPSEKEEAIGVYPGSGADDLPIKVSLFPNPTRDRLMVESENMFQSVEVFNLLGQRLKLYQFEGTRKFEFSVSDLPSGTYILIVHSGNQTINHKFTKID